MTRRFYAPPESFSDEGARVALSREETRHLSGVLRLAAGEEVRVFDGAGREFLCVVADDGRGGARDEGRGGNARQAMLEVRARVEPLCAESALDLTLACALLKGEKFDLVVQKATELGVARIVPVETARADVRLLRGVAASKRVERWRRVALEAAKQSGRARVMSVDAPRSLTQLLTEETMRGAAAAREILQGASSVSGANIATGEAATSAAYGTEDGGTGDGGTGDASRCLIFAERGGRRLVETIGGWATKPARVVALVGSEGGWTDAEIEQAKSAGWQAVTLGGRILRAETAGIVVAALLQHLFGDLV